MRNRNAEVTPARATRGQEQWGADVEENIGDGTIRVGLEYVIVGQFSEFYLRVWSAAEPKGIL